METGPIYFIKYLIIYSKTSFHLLCMMDRGGGI